MSMRAREAPAIRLYTSCWARLSEVRAAGLIPVRVSIGIPRRIGSPRDVPFAPSLAPWGLLSLTDEDEFRRRYRHQLHKRGRHVLAELEQIALDHDEQALVLLCFEDLRDPGVWCHRRHAAEWLQEEVGLEVPELPETPSP